MMKQRICEACNASYPENVKRRQLYTVVKYDIERCFGKRHIKDLCPKCYKKVLDIFGVDEKEGYSIELPTKANRKNMRRESCYDYEK